MEKKRYQSPCTVVDSMDCDTPLLLNSSPIDTSLPDTPQPGVTFETKRRKSLDAYEDANNELWEEM